MGARWLYDSDENLVLDESLSAVCEPRRAEDGPMLAVAAEATEIIRETIDAWATIKGFPELFLRLQELAYQGRTMLTDAGLPLKEEET